jgi:hypothetical protein
MKVKNGETMTRKHPNARRAVALSLLAGFLFVASASAWFNPSPASAETNTTTPGRRPLPGDPNTPDEGGRTAATSRITDPTPSTWVVTWLKGMAHFAFLAR